MATTSQPIAYTDGGRSHLALSPLWLHETGAVDFSYYNPRGIGMR
jgi:hypothetical protein